MALKAKRMKGLRVDEVSGVDAPAHLAQGWMVLKALGGADPIEQLTDEQIEQAIKALGADEQGEPVTDELIATLTKARDSMPDAAAKAATDNLIAALGAEPGKGAGDDPVAKAVAEALAKATTERDEALAAKTVAEEALAKATGPAPAESEEVALAKAMESWPEPVRKAWADQQERLAKAEEKAAEAVKKADDEHDARVSAEYLTKAKGADYAALPASAETRATILREVDEKLSKEAGAELHRILKAATNVIVTKGADFTEWGGAGGDVDVTGASGAMAQLEKAADEIQKADPSIDRPTAILKAADTSPELARAYQEGQG